MAQLAPGVVVVSGFSGVAAMGSFWVAGCGRLDLGNGLALCGEFFDQLVLLGNLRAKGISNPHVLAVLAFDRFSPSTRSDVHELVPVHDGAVVIVSVRLIEMENARASVRLTLFSSGDSSLGSPNVG